MLTNNPPTLSLDPPPPVDLDLAIVFRKVIHTLSSDPLPQVDLDLPIVFQKVIHTFVAHPISLFVSYDQVSSLSSFALFISFELYLRNYHEAMQTT